MGGVAWGGLHTSKVPAGVSGRKLLGRGLKARWMEVGLVRGHLVVGLRCFTCNDSHAMEKAQRSCVFEVESSRGEAQCEVGIGTHNVPRYKCDLLAHLPQCGLKLSAVPHLKDSTIDVPAHHHGGCALRDYPR